MKKTKLFMSTAILATTFFAACGPSSKSDGTITKLEQNGNTLTVCDFAKVTDTLNVPLSEWVEDCQLVRFENIDTALFKMWWPAITDNYIGIRQSGGVFKLFDHKGKFLHDIGAMGQGPGEYAGSLYSELIDEKNKAVYLAPFFGSTKILKYNLDGTFVTDYDLGERLNKPKLALNPDGSISVVHLCFQGMSEMMGAVIMPDTIIKYIPTPGQAINPRDKDGAFVGFNNEIWSNNNVDGFKFMMMPIDTLYNYNPIDNKMEAQFALANPPVGEDVFLIYDELPGKYLATIWGKGTIAVDTKNNNSHYVKLVNDYFGGLPASMNFTNGWFFAMYEPAVLMEKIEKRMAESDCTDKDKELLKGLLESLDENDNNVMFVGKLKK